MRDAAQIVDYALIMKKEPFDVAVVATRGIHTEPTVLALITLLLLEE